MAAVQCIGTTCPGGCRTIKINAYDTCAECMASRRYMDLPDGGATNHYCADYSGGGSQYYCPGSDEYPECTFNVDTGKYSIIYCCTNY